jgi:hypothetical protein
MPAQKQPTCCRRQTVGGHEQLIIETNGGQTITLKDGAGIVIEDTNGNSITMANGKVTVKTPGVLALQAAMVEIDGSILQINAAMIQCSGVVKCETLEATSVVASNYTPGAGNVW